MVAGSENTSRSKMKKITRKTKAAKKTLDIKKGRNKKFFAERTKDQTEPSLQKQRTSQAGSTLWQTIMPVVLFVLVIALYLPSTSNDFIYDDLTLISDQATPRSLIDIFRVFGERHWYNLPYYRPVCRLTMVGQKFIHANDPGQYHLFNAVLMGVAALLAYALLRLPAFNIRTLPALVGAGLFAVHPIASCTVYPICSGRETLIPAVFVMASVYAFLLSARGWYVLAMAMFGLSLLSKEQAVIVPGLFVLADTLGISADAPGRSMYKWVRRYTPVFLILLVYFLIRWMMFGGTGEYRLAVLNSPSGPFLSLLYTLQTIFVPFVELVYEPKLKVWISAWRQLLVLAALILLVVATYRRRSVVRSKVFFWLGWFLLALLPTSNLLVQEARFAERYGFLALMGVIGIVGVLVSMFWNRPSARRWITVAGISLLVACGAISFHRNTYFKNHKVFMRQWLHTDRESFQAHVSIGEILQREGRLDEAIHHYHQAIQLKSNYEDAHNNLGLAYYKKGMLENAISEYKKALAINPDLTMAHYNLGLAYYKKGMLENAISEYKKALAINPDLTIAHYNLGLAYCKKDRLDEAISEYKKTLAIDPSFSNAHNNLGVTYYHKGNYKLAIIHFDKAVELGCRVDTRLVELLKPYR